MSTLYRVCVILLVFFVLEISCASAANVVSFDPHTVEMFQNSSHDFQIIMDEFPQGLSGFNMTISVSDPEIAEITSVTFPGWNAIPSNSTLPSSSVWIKGIDLSNQIVSGNTSVLLANITLKGKEIGNTNLTISNIFYDPDGSFTEHSIPGVIRSKINVLEEKNNESPIINSIILSNNTPKTGDPIIVTVNVTGNIGVISVNANDIPLINQGGSIWNGSFTALEGTHSVNVSIMDAAGNVAWNNSTSYTAVTFEPKTILVDNDGPADYSTIQAAVDNASSGDTIIVKPGTYTENILVNVPGLTIRSESNPGNVKVKPVDESKSTFIIDADSTTITGLKITGASQDFDKSAITLYSNMNNLTGNTIENGCILLGSQRIGNLITENKISNGGGEGIHISCCGFDTNIISNNTISNCSIGIYEYDQAADIRNNTITDCGYGIELAQASSVIDNNTILNCNVGIILREGCNVDIINNKIMSCDECGIFDQENFGGQQVYNNYLNNTLNVKLGPDEGGNTWNTSLTQGMNIAGGPYIGGNFWAKPDGTGFSQTSVDMDGNGIGDSPYNVSEGEFDYLPLVSPSSSSNPIGRINFTDKIIHVLDHSDSPMDGNWIIMQNLQKDRQILLPHPIKFTYSGPKSKEYKRVSGTLHVDKNDSYTITYPSSSQYLTFPIYLPNENVSMSFYGERSLKGDVEIYLFNVTLDSSQGILDSLKAGDTKNLDKLFQSNMDGKYKMYSATLGENGDLLNYDFGPLDAGQYCIVMIQKNKDINLTVLSAAAVVVAKYDISVSVPDCIVEGDNLKIKMTLKDAPNLFNCTYGAVLIKDQAYKAAININSDESRKGTSVVINDIDVIDKFGINSSNYRSKFTKGELQTEIQTLIGEGNGAISIGERGNKALSLTTFDLPAGEYHLFVGAYSPEKGLIGLTQRDIEIESEGSPVSVLPAAIFVTSVNKGYAPLTVKFTEYATRTTSWNWDFDNDGNIDSTSRNPTYVYATPGTYAARLIVSNKYGHDSKSTKITVLAEPRPEPKPGVFPVADFETNVSYGYVPLSVRFTDHSEHATELSWDFNNDGVIDSTDLNPVYVYTSPGIYTVSLIASNEKGKAAKTSTIIVSQPYSPNNKRNRHHGTGTGKAVVIHKNEVSDPNAGTNGNGALNDNQKSSPGSNQDAGNAVKDINPISEQEDDTGSPANESKKTPGFEIICGITGLLAVYLYRKNKN